MTDAQLREIWEKTNGHCHFCGDPVSLRKRGYRRQRADGCWEVDHVSQRARGGATLVENCLQKRKVEKEKWGQIFTYGIRSARMLKMTVPA